MNKKYEQSYQDILDIEKSFKKSLLADIKDSYLVVFIMGWMMSYIILPIGMYTGNFGDVSTFIILGLPIVWIGFYTICRRINMFIGEIIQKFFRRILDKLSLLNKDISIIDGIKNILEKNEEIYKLFITIDSKKKLLSIVGRGETKKYFVDYSNIIIKYLLIILTDLRSDLSTRLAEQQKILESTKSEVIQNIIGSSELNQVSELQKARLDKQIEQFEELQRVLVRM